MKIVVHDRETEEWVDLGVVPFKGLPRTNGVIEMDKNGILFLYRVISVQQPMTGEMGTMMVREIGSAANCRESIYKGDDF